MKLFFWAPLLLFGWYIYFTASNNTIFLVLLIIASVVLFLSILRDFRILAAAENVVAAAATFNTLSEMDKSRVHDHAIQIIRRSGWRGTGEPSFMDDAERYGWYALSMAELGINAVCITTKWNFVKNPFFAISIRDSNIDAALRLAKKEGFDVKISRSSEINKLHKRPYG